MHEHWGKSFFCPMDNKMISPYTEWCIGKCPCLMHNFLQNKHMVHKVYAVIRFVGILLKYPFYAKLCSGGFNNLFLT